MRVPLLLGVILLGWAQGPAAAAPSEIRVAAEGTRPGPGGVAGLNRTHISVHQLAVEAALTGNRDALYQAVMLDPHTASVLSLDEIWRMTDELVDAHGNALPAFAPRRLVGGPGRPGR